jgi:hypothetical protein
MTADKRLENINNTLAWIEGYKYALKSINSGNFRKNGNDWSICPTCNKVFVDPAEIEFIDKLNQCASCDHLTAEEYI